MPSSYKHNFKDPNLNNLHTAMTYTDVDTPTVRVEVTKIPEVEVKNDQGVSLKVDVVTIPEVEVKNDSGNPLRVNVITIPEVEIKNDTGNPVPISGTVAISSIPEVEIKNTVGNAIPISGTVSINSIPEVEIKNTVGNPIPISGTVSVDNFAPVTLANTSLNDASGRLRTSNTRLLGEFRNMYGTTGPMEIQTHFEGAGTQTIPLSETAALLQVSDQAGDRALRQSRQYHPYIPGASQLAYITFTMDTPKPGLTQQVGLFDDANGILLQVIDLVTSVTVRRAGVDTAVAQSDWNLDKLNGLGPSRQILDISKSQILVIDYRWLGVGRVRVGFEISGTIVYVHEFLHANTITGVYTYQPSLPVRWEIKTHADTISPSQLRCICYAVYTEGSEIETGFSASISTGATAISLNGLDNVGILAVRLRNTVNGIPVRALARLTNWYIMSTVDIGYRLIVLPGSSSIVGSHTWQSTGTTTWSEYITNFQLANDLTYAQTIYDGFNPGNTGNNSATAGTPQNINRSSTIYQNYDATDSMIIAMVGNKLNNNASVHASLSWIEVK